METKINIDEQIDDLNYQGLRIIQKKKGFRFGTDAVLLADFACKVSAKKVLDLCSGTGIVSLLLSGHTSWEELHALEIQADVVDMAKKTVQINGLENRVFIKQGDLKNGADLYNTRTFDVITCNPPYIKNGSGIYNTDDTKLISRHEIACSLEDVVKVSSKLLKEHGRFFMVHRPNRLTDMICTMRDYKIEPKRIRFVHHSYNKPPILVLIEGVLLGGIELIVENPLYICEKNGEYTQEMKQIYRRK